MWGNWNPSLYTTGGNVNGAASMGKQSGGSPKD